MTFSNAELVRLWPSVPDSRCTACDTRTTCTWTLAPTWLLCAWCWWAKFAGDDEPMPVLRADYEMTTGGST